MVRKALRAELIRTQLMDSPLGIEPQVEYARQLEIRLAVLRTREQELERDAHLSPKGWERWVFWLYIWATKERFDVR